MARHANQSQVLGDRFSTLACSRRFAEHSNSNRHFKQVLVVSVVKQGDCHPVRFSGPQAVIAVEQLLAIERELVKIAFLVMGGMDDSYLQTLDQRAKSDFTLIVH